MKTLMTLILALGSLRNRHLIAILIDACLAPLIASLLQPDRGQTHPAKLLTPTLKNLDKTQKNRYTNCYYDETFIYQRLKTETHPIRWENRDDRDFQRAGNRYRHAPREKH